MAMHDGLLRIPQILPSRSPAACLTHRSVHPMGTPPGVVTEEQTLKTLYLVRVNISELISTMAEGDVKLNIWLREMSSKTVSGI